MVAMQSMKMLPGSREVAEMIDLWRKGGMVIIWRNSMLGPFSADFWSFTSFAEDDLARAIQAGTFTL